MKSEDEASEKRSAGVPFTSENTGEQQLWNELKQLQQASPSSHLRRRFYDALDRAGASMPANRWRVRLGLRGTPGLTTAVSCLAVGLVMGLLLSGLATDREELSELQQQVARLNRNLILDRLDSDSANKRLLGVMDAVELAQHDTEVAGALLARAVDDRIYSVRSAAIDAIGSRIDAPAVGNELMASLEKTGSPLVQLALVDLVLRHGSAGQLEQLLQLTERRVLHPDVVQHIKSSVSRNRT